MSSETPRGNDYSLSNHIHNASDLTVTRTNLFSDCYNIQTTLERLKSNTITHTSNTTVHITSTERTTWNNKANASHTHTIANITNLQNTLDGKSSTSHNHSGVYQPAGSYASASHNHDSVYQAKGSYAPASHVGDSTHVTAAEKAKWNSLASVIPSGMIVWYSGSTNPDPDNWEIYTPLVGKYPLGATSDIGTSVSAGLPNITGRLFNEADNTFASVTTGAFYTSGSGNLGLSGGRDYDNAFTYFDASRSNSIYGASDTVTPPSVKLLPLKRK